MTNLPDSLISNFRKESLKTMARLRVLIFVMAATICVAIQMKGKRKFWVGVHVVLTGLSLWVGHSLNFLCHAN